MEEGEYFAIETFGSTGRGRAFARVCGCIQFVMLRVVNRVNRENARTMRKQLTLQAYLFGEFH